MDKLYRFNQVKAVDEQTHIVTAYVSTYQWDRMDERFAKGAWKLDAFRRNPVVLWAHDNHEPPIGKALRIEEDERGLVAETLFDSGSERAMDVFRLYKEGFLSGFSVGFIPKKYEMETVEGTRKGVVYQDAELLEYSAVPIPANPGAVMTHETAALVVKAIGPAAVKQVGEGYVFVNQKTDQKPDFEKSILALIELSKDVRRAPLDASKLTLVKSALGVMQEIVDAHEQEVTADDFERLKRIAVDYAETLKALYPRSTPVVDRLISQIGDALKGQAA